MKTIIVNCLAGPGAGKTTAAWEIASELKKRNIITEYVSEYAKELVWDNKLDLLDGSEKNQAFLLEEQNYRLNRLAGKVSVVVTDSPLILNYQYLKDPSEKFLKKVLVAFDSYNNFNVFIKRGNSFEKEGRIHDFKESVSIDEKILGFLKENNIYFGTYSHNSVSVICDNIQYSLKNNEKFNKATYFSNGQISAIEEAKKQGLSEKQISIFSNENYSLEKTEFICNMFMQKKYREYQLLKPYFDTANLDVLKHLSNICGNWREDEVKFVIDKSLDVSHAIEICNFIKSKIKVNPYLKAGFTNEMLRNTFEIINNQKCSLETFNNFALDKNLTLEEKRKMLRQENSFVLEIKKDIKFKQEEIIPKNIESLAHDER